MIQGIDHIDIAVGDLDEFVKFFEAMGLKVIRRTSHGGGAVELQHPGDNQPIFELHAATDSRPKGLRHIAFKVDDIHKSQQEFSANGLVFDQEPHFVEATGRSLSSVFDPDGTKVQFVQAH